MRLQEWHNDGSKWVYIGQWPSLSSEDAIQPLVDKWLKDNTKLILIDDEGEFVREYV